MNRVFLIGNLTREPELSETNSGISVCRISIAVNRRRTGDGEPQTDFFNVTAWRGLADNVAKYCKKGNKIAVSGSIQIRQYEANDGTKRTAVDVVAEDVEFLTPKSQENEAAPKKKPALEPFEDDSDIPF
nr:MAG TPA: Single strand binding protein [Caudoviricetes sp.]